MFCPHTRAFPVGCGQENQPDSLYGTIHRLVPQMIHTSVAPNACQDKAGRSDFPHFAIRATPGKNAEIAGFLSLHTTNMAV